MKKDFNKELVTTKEDDEDFKNSTKFGSVIMIMLIMMLKNDIVVTSVENVEVQHIEIVTSTLT